MGKKSYSNPMMPAKIFRKQKLFTGNISDKEPMSSDDPRLIANTIAIAEPPATAEIFEKRKSRLSKLP